MGSIVHCLDHYHIVFLFYYPSLTNPIFHFAQKDDTDKLGDFFIVMDYVINRVVFSLQIVEYNIFNYIGQSSKDRHLLKIQGYKVFLVRCSAILLAYLRYRHHFGFIVLIHEIDEALLLDEPFGELTVLFLTNIQCLCVGVPMTMLFYLYFILQR